MSNDAFVEQAEQDFAEAFIFENPGDKIVGRVTEASQGWSDQSESYYPILTILDEDTDTRKAVHCFWVALQREMAKWRPQIGERVAVIRKEDKPNKIKGRKDIKIFRVQVEGRTPDIYSNIGKQPTQIPDTPVMEDNDENEETPF